MDNRRRTRDRGKLFYDSRRIGDVYLHRLVLASVVTEFTARLTNRRPAISFRSQDRDLRFKRVSSWPISVCVPQQDVVFSKPIIARARRD